MADEEIKRKLTVALNADLEGYTRLMGQHEFYTTLSGSPSGTSDHLVPLVRHVRL